MNLDDIDFEAEWLPFKEAVGTNYFLKYHDHIEIIFREAKSKLYAIDGRVIDVWTSMNLIDDDYLWKIK